MALAKDGYHDTGLVDQLADDPNCDRLRNWR